MIELDDYSRKIHHIIDPGNADTSNFILNACKLFQISQKPLGTCQRNRHI